MKSGLLAGLLALCLGQAAYAQTTTTKPNNIPTRQDPNSPYGTGWAKPGGTTGGYIYRDPRQPDPNSSRKSQSQKRCAGPLMYDPASGACR